MAYPAALAWASQALSVSHNLDACFSFAALAASKLVQAKAALPASVSGVLTTLAASHTTGMCAAHAARVKHSGARRAIAGTIAGAAVAIHASTAHAPTSAQTAFATVVPAVLFLWAERGLRVIRTGSTCDSGQDTPAKTFGVPLLTGLALANAGVMGVTLVTALQSHGGSAGEVLAMFVPRGALVSYVGDALAHVVWSYGAAKLCSVG